MEDVNKTDCLSFGDSLFLHLERPGMPLHVAALCIFEGEIYLEDCIKYIQSKLSLVPRYRQRVIPPPFGLGVLHWESDPTFDIRNHLHEIKLKHGTVTELQSAAARILSTTLDRQKPLWDFTLFTRLQRNRTAMLLRVHHCLADGISGVELLSLLLDAEPNVPMKSTKSPRIKVPPPRDQASLLLDGLGASCFSALERILAAESQLLNLAQEFTAGAAHLGRVGRNGNESGNIGDGSHIALSREMTSLFAEFGSPPDRLPFNVICRGPQKFFWTEVPFSDIRAIKKTCSATVNDVVLTLVASAIRLYAHEHQIPTAGRVLRIVVPVSVRTGAEKQGLGNKITFVPVTVPLGSQSPRGLLEAIHKRMELIKKVRIAEMVGLAGTILGAIPVPFQALAGPIFSQLPLSVCNLICTNVPGPQTPLYLLGHKMLTFYPYVPIGGEMGMNCAVLTYNDKAFIGFTGDVNAIPDLKLLPRLLQIGFQKLRKSAGLQRAGKIVKPVLKKGAAKMNTPARTAFPPSSINRASAGSYLAHRQP
jgi:diacylglycerol O-acyltransferase